ncbi:hypothetical protein SS1G_00861 [Sclerotinia sclerotiorum 1980 UF-70]|uniref:Agmatinase n=1 Tax=Sclerotinia sclerotiorum (strain ATCC 18683 / 1980 / Ss-1) TaxID=665079 RepID=A7E6D6_SCLS1|nr:hypothetical protein SS1G_00861 [Sclerotinia sclerotiorum 1980 UF-70]EDN91458.1 hypothetical protein SS1G_00861 [Sclerotinia sclerotiorum 1980 UF-70]
MVHSIIPFLTFLPPVIAAIAPSGPYQRPLKHPKNQHENFIASSIFGPYQHEVLGFEEPVALKPSIDNGVNPFRSWATVVDCGDIVNTPFDKHLALKQLENGMSSINSRRPKNDTEGKAIRAISIGGDHTITKLGGGLSKYTDVNHGTMLHIAHEEGLLSNHSNMHLGTRCPLMDQHFDLDNDLRCGFKYIRAKELDKLGIEEVVRRIVDTVGDEYVYLSVDIDVLDPAYAPATGTIEPGGWTTRELLQIIGGLSKAGLKIVGSDIVEFTPVYDNSAETTGIVAGEIIYEILQWMVHVPVTPRK